MDRMKTLGLYALILIGVYILSDFLIFMGLNSTYDKIESVGSSGNSQVQIDNAEATLVNGRISGTIKNSADNDLNGKYIKIDLFSEQGVNLGTKYLEVNNLAKDGQEKFETYFKAQGVENYKISIVDEYIENSEEIKDVFQNQDVKQNVILGTLALLFFL